MAECADGLDRVAHRVAGGQPAVRIAALTLPASGTPNLSGDEGEARDHMERQATHPKTGGRPPGAAFARANFFTGTKSMFSMGG